MVVKQKAEPTVDVIIPTYNGLPWLKSTIESVLEQTHKNLQLYVIDDGSTDEGETEKYVTKLVDRRVHYHRKSNGGQATARNVGIKLSTAPFIAFLDSDDVWYPTKLEKQLALMQKSPSVGLVYGHHYIIDEDDTIMGNLRLWKRGKIFNDLCAGNFIAGSASMVLIRREVFDEVGLFHEDFLIGEDWEMWLRIAKVYEIDFVPEIIAALRQRKEGMQQNQKKMADGLVYNYDVMRRELGLTKPQEKILAAYCLYHAGVDYMRIGRRDLARRTLLKLFLITPRQALKLDQWKLHFGFGIFTRIVFGNPITDAIHYVYEVLIYLLKSITRAIFRLIKPSRR